MRVELEYGRTGLSVDLPDDRVVRSLAYKDAPPLADPAFSLRQVIEHPTGTQPLAELARGRKNACVLICDITRPVPNQLILPQFSRRLSRAEFREQITILVATGLHRPNLGDELVEMVGQDIVDNYRIENHHGTILEEHVFLGTSPRGVPI